ncbi:MAG: hypothetical protein HQL03_05185 [Nitrospirae bacterium]|nr:hypothetical protein [Nitrospirota bacterium]MBF0592309.1 hypothetical protein [Nitrospirota bacterium]
MYIDYSTVKTSSGKSHTRILLRESYREKVPLHSNVVTLLPHSNNAIL